MRDERFEIVIQMSGYYVVNLSDSLSLPDGFILQDLRFISISSTIQGWPFRIILFFVWRHLFYNDYRTLLKKLNQFGFTRNIIDFFKSYVEFRCSTGFQFVAFAIFILHWWLGLAAKFKQSIICWWLQNLFSL